MAENFVSPNEDKDIEYVLSPEVQVIERMKKRILPLIDPAFLCPFMTCLTRPDQQAVVAKQKADGEMRAVVVLLDKLVCRKNFWKDFLDALSNEDVGLEYVATELIKDLEKLKQEKDEEIKTVLMKVEGPPESAINTKLLASNVPPKKRKLCTDKNEDSEDERYLKYSRDSNESSSEEDYKDCLEETPSKEINAINKRVKEVVIEGIQWELIDLTNKEQTPREYQKALAKPAQKGHNTIICAPTGSGKTMVASLICKSHLENMYPKKKCLLRGEGKDGEAIGPRSKIVEEASISQPKILIIVPRFAILLHVYKELKQALPIWRVGKRSGASKKKTPLNKMFEDNQVMVVTADIFRNALMSDFEKCMEITDPTLIIFDECHYTIQDHSYNMIMTEYLKVKHDHQAKQLPQIIGLSASPGAGRKVSDKEAQERILTLCANLDTKIFMTVPEDFQEELEKHVSTPTKHIKIVTEQRNDPFTKHVIHVMEKIENSAGIQSSSVEKGTQEYESLVVNVKTEAEKQSQNGKRKCTEHLMIYNKAIILVKLTRMIDGYNLLEDSFKTLKLRNDEDGLDQIEYVLLEKYQDIVEKLKSSAGMEQDYPNPKLEQLKKALIDHDQACVKGSEEFRAIIFVKTKLLTKALKDWMNSDSELSKLNPEVFTSIHADEESGGMTHGKQCAVIKRFQDGDTKILISTSVGEEGIDIPDCNMVVKYNHVTNEIAMVQSRGRARKNNAVELVIGDLNVAEKDKVNVLLEEKMENAIKAVQGLEKGQFQQHIEEIQLEHLLLRQQKADQLDNLRNSYQADEIELKCKGCDIIQCKASDIRVFGDNSYINPNPEFRDKVCILDHPNEKWRAKGIKKIQCVKCKSDWGNIAGTHPCLKLKSFICVIKGEGKSIKQWCRIPCKIEKFKA